MATTTQTKNEPEAKKNINLLGAIFIGIGSTVGAGIFALFGQKETLTTNT